MKPFSIFLVAIFLLWLNAPASAAPRAQMRSDAFEPVACDTFKIYNDAFECGYVRVPELHSDPNGKQIKLAVAILPSPNAYGSRSAFVVAQGGPGGSTLDTFADFFGNDYFPALKTLNAERDIILYDQRGTLYAQPNLICHEELDFTLATIEQHISPDDALQASEQAALQCRERLINEGINLSAYNSIENARDVDDLRRALGYEKFDYYGISYGTLLALHAMRETPDSLRSVILDAVVPAQINANSNVPASMHRAFNELFTACANDAACARAFPNLEQTFYETVDALDMQPARVSITDDETGKTYNAVLDGDTYMNLLFQFIYNSEAIPALPKMIHDAHDGRFDMLRLLWPLIAFDRTFASGMYYSVTCAEDADFTLDELALDGVDAHIANAQKRDTAAFLQLCEKWNVPQLGARADEPVKSEIPTLIFSGNFDPITPPPFGQAAAENIQPSYAFVFPAYAHGALTSGNCPNEMIAEFVRDPSRAPNAQCIKNVSRVDFITPANFLFSSGMGALQYAMLQGKIQEFVVPLLSVLILLTVILVGPLLWLARRTRNLPAEKNWLARLAPWFAAWTGGAAAFFLAVWLIAVVVITLTNNNIVGLVLGAPNALVPLFVLPILSAVGAVLLCIGVAAAWLRGIWQMSTRVYYTVLAAAAIALTSWFAVNGALTMFLG